MILMILRKMMRNRWLVLCLLVGSIVAVAMVSSIPLYTDGVLQRMLTRDLEQFQETSGSFAGRYTVRKSYEDPLQPFVVSYARYDALAHEKMIPALGIPVLAWTNQLVVDYLEASPVPRREAAPKRRLIKLEGFRGAQDHLRIVQGRLFASGLVDGAIEAVVSEQAFIDLDLRLDELYAATDLRMLLAQPLRIRVVGTYSVNDPRDLWWFQGLWNYTDVAIADYDLVRGMFADPQTRLLTASRWSFALDYHAITLGNLSRIVNAFEAQLAFLLANEIDFTLPMIEVLRAYVERERALLSTLWFLQVPVLVMLAFFLSMVSILIIDAERNEIAVLKSRGAGGGQVFLVYLLESLFLGAAALAAGPPLGVLVCRVIGAGNGFMEFVQRAALNVPLSPKAYLYAGLSAGFLVVTMLLPASLAARTTIVHHKRSRSRADKAPNWRRFFPDLILIALAGYGYYGYRTQWTILARTGMKATELPLDPLVVLVSTFFILGVGLLFLRVYPALVRLLFRAGRRVWPAVLYAPFLHIGRSGGQEQFLMLFLMLTLSIGILDARIARTINRNVQERIQYATGADITLREKWPADTAATGSNLPAVAGSRETLVYREPDFARFASLQGAAAATKVFRKKEVLVAGTLDPMFKASFMAIVPHEFGGIAWFRPDLLPSHWNQYLNLLTENPNAFLVSQSFADVHGVRLGDTIYVTWTDHGYLDGIVYGFVRYWPTYNAFGAGEGETSELVVANLAYEQAKMATEPYEVWIRKAAGASSAEVYGALQEKGIPIESLADATPALVAAKNDAMLQGINGALTMGFIVAMIVCTSGYLIYWILSLQGRVLQFGTFRAIGLPRRALIGMIAWEQVLISLVALAAGVVIGGAAADLFVPLLALTRNASQQVPPFKVIAEAGDYVKLYAIIAAMLGLGLGILGVRISRIRISQALKLGEE